MNRLNAAGRVARREFRRIARRPLLWGTLILAPLVLSVLVAGVYARRVVEDIPIAVCDLDRSELSRSLVRMFESTRSLKIAAYAQSAEEIEQGIRMARVQGGLLIPEHFETDVKSAHPARVVVYKNTSNLIIGNLIYRDAATIIRTFSGGVLLKKLRSSGKSEEQAMGIVNPIRLDTYSLFNPGYNYSNFLVASLLPVMFQMLIMLAAALSVNSEYEERTFAEWRGVSGGSTWAMILGKALPYLALGGAMMLGLIGIVFPAAGIPIHGSVGVLLLLSTIYVAAVVFPALWISSCTRQGQTATEIVVLLTTPAYLFSGETFPLTAAPRVYEMVAQLLPSTHYLKGLMQLQHYGAPVAYLLPAFAALLTFAGLAWAGLWWNLARRDPIEPEPVASAVQS